MVVAEDNRGARYELEARTDGAPFWLVLGQSDNRGWSLSVPGAEVGERQIVDGYANGWLVTPDRAGRLSMALTWTPQRLVWIALALSGLMVAVCLGILVVGRRRRPTEPPLGHQVRPRLAQPAEGVRRLTPGAPGLAVAVGIVVLLVATPMAAALASAAVLVGLLVPRTTWVLASVAPALVLLARTLERPTLAWWALALVAADLSVDVITTRTLSRRPAAEG